MDLAIIDQSKPGVPEEQVELVNDVLNYAGNYLSLPDNTEMSVTFVNNDEIQRYNREYRGLDKATDVISFAIEDDGDDMPLLMDDEMVDDIAKNIGDIIVSVDKIGEQAEYLEHSYERELGFLVVHGFLHLNGYDHMRSEADEKIMFDLQREILDSYGLKR
ncbi:Metal-dependent hydrolase YbeY, involved in rRNA and/or ribosome maturation and assembly [Weissella jogaejeotgali]|uniref:Endoribonuclease YbeY n=2 Tax=Weissella TaxID=46255 RepID=A0A1L6RC80_9LACO|nr:rRNA maturation RNase YbeY [Weissella jogaejeotgali]APS42135.1 Metal-dependent hydrolase YbeY, involved in rRNA and/or ribosome maturation and assembly [Weissella jogaejeotgali]CCC57229.1 probable rRNA maturation factor [Weissella thailandensis fsh4-2]